MRTTEISLSVTMLPRQRVRSLIVSNTMACRHKSTSWLGRFSYDLSSFSMALRGFLREPHLARCSCDTASLHLANLLGAHRGELGAEFPGSPALGLGLWGGSLARSMGRYPREELAHCFTFSEAKTLAIHACAYSWSRQLHALRGARDPGIVSTPNITSIASGCLALSLSPALTPPVGPGAFWRLNCWHWLGESKSRPSMRTTFARCSMGPWLDSSARSRAHSSSYRSLSALISLKEAWVMRHFIAPMAITTKRATMLKKSWIRSSPVMLTKGVSLW
mmetsp:Transcript_55320/g.135478  ORF Transcript_55320/g.135478 Transcript_55320/m.135478 type:complete len:277 (-) Transcript_55320:1051-1881(-)